VRTATIREPVLVVVTSTSFVRRGDRAYHPGEILRVSQRDAEKLIRWGAARRVRG
jgi:hypothetical protein